MTLVRQEVNQAGVQTVEPTLANLAGASRLPVTDFTGNTGVMGGANGVSWGTIVAGSAFNPGSAVDSFTPHQSTVKVNYYVKGVGLGTQSGIPQAVQDFDFGHSDLANSTFFYLYLPLLDLFSGGLAGQAVFQLLQKGAVPAVEELTKLGQTLKGFAQEQGFKSAFVSWRSGVSGDPSTDFQAATAIMTDMLILAAGYFGSAAVQTVTAEAIVAIAVSGGVVGLTAPGVALVLGFLAVFLSIGGALIGLVNLGVLAKQFASLPAMTKLEIKLGGYELFNAAGPRSLFLNVDGSGDAIYQHVLVAPDGKQTMESVLHPLEHPGSPPSDQILLLQAFPTASGSDVTRFFAANDKGQITAMRSVGGVQETLILQRQGKAIQSTQVIASGSLTPGSNVGDTSSVHFPIAINNLGDVAGSVQVRTVVPNGGGGQTAVSTISDAFLSSSGGPPVRLNLANKLKALYAFLNGDPVILRVFDLNDARQILFSFEYFQQVVGVALFDIDKNGQVEIVQEVRLAIGEGNGIERFPTGFLSNSSTYRVFTEYSTGYTGHRHTVIPGKSIKKEARSLTVAGVAEDGTVGGFAVADGKLVARVWYTGEGDSLGQVESKHEALLALAGQDLGNSRIASVGSNGHMVGTIDLPSGVAVDFGIRPPDSSSNPTA